MNITLVRDNVVEEESKHTGMNLLPQRYPEMLNFDSRFVVVVVVRSQEQANRILDRFERMRRCFSSCVCAERRWEGFMVVSERVL